VNERLSGVKRYLQVRLMLCKIETNDY